MSYEEFPDEFEILKGSLENEDYDRAESVLLMILQKKPDFQQAKLDLERVRGKLGSISNYEFRVRAFLEQGDLRTAGEIVAEASAKFQKNRKIKQLIEFFQQKAGTGGSTDDAPAASSGGAGGAVADSDESELPNLETFTGNLDAGTMKKVKENLGLSAPLGGGGAGGGLPTSLKGDPPGGPRTAEEEPPDLSGGDKPRTTTGLQSRRSALKGGQQTGKRGRKGLSGADIVARRANRFEGSLGRDAIVTGVIAVVFLGLAGLLLAVVSGAASEAVAPPAAPASSAILDTIQFGEFKTSIEAWDSLDEGAKERFIGGLMDEDITRFANSGGIEFVDVVYAHLRKHADDPVVGDLMGDFSDWRYKVRQTAGVNTPVDPAAIAVSTWAPGNEDEPPTYGVAPLQSNTISVVTSALIMAVPLGVMLGVALAWCRIPMVNRVFHLIWEIWYAMPAVAMLFIAAVWYAPQAGGEALAFATGAMTLAMAPHIAFYCRQGFENIVNRGMGMSIGLIVVTIISATLAAAARFAAEAVLVFGIAASVSDAPALAPVNTMGREMLVALQGLDFLVKIPETNAIAAATHYNIAVYLTFWLLLISLAGSVLAQLLQAGVAWEGLKNAEPESETEMPEHRSQQPFSMRNLGSLAVGLAVVALFALVGMSIMGSISNRMEAGTGWSDLFIEANVSTITSQTITFAGAAGLVAALLGWGLMVVPAIVIDTRRMRAMIDCVFRIPTAIPPVVLAMVVVIILRDMGGMNWNVWLTAAVTGLLLAPLASAVLYTGWSQYRRGPYVRDEQGFLPKSFGLWFARFFEFAGATMFLAAVAAGTVVMVVALGASTSPGEGEFRLLPVHLLAALQAGGIESAAAHAYFGQLMTIVLGLLGLGFIARLAAEVMARFALSRRGPGIGFEDFDG